ncbi:MAG: hypothetical protein CMK89_23370 [Pseudomonadales bacterium]|nr:hypothetical protein [Pseudomonadales bacterium]
MRSAIYQGVISHQRRQGPEHSFAYPIFMAYLDLDELTDFFSLSPAWSMERFNWASFHRNDYLNPSIPDLKQAVVDTIKRNTGTDFDGRVCMLGHVRYFGIGFNPATFYFCFDNDELKYVITEVTNTPWNEKHAYVLSANDINRRQATAKTFHVSPFLDMDMEYHWRISPPLQSTTISITNVQNGQPVFNATLKMDRLEATPRNLNTILLKFPAVTLKTITGIYWHALRLWLKGAPIYQHPKTFEDHTS